VKAENQFDVCLREIVNSGVTIEQANTACADALIPRDLSYCVQAISKNTAIAPEDALKNCYLVRRPVDMANCVVDIDKQILIPQSVKSQASSKTTTEKPETQVSSETTTEKPENQENLTTSETTTEESPLMLALETCTTTVLPIRHSQCVIGLSRTPQPMSPVKAMESCISAEDFPRDLFSDY
jgi:hypothetical protein